MFHVSNQVMEKGLVLDPGRWGRTVRMFRPGGPIANGHDLPIILWEVALEAARLAIAPAAVSRLECVFALASIGDVEWWLKYRPNSHVYEIRLVANDTPIDRRDFAAISDMSPAQEAYADYMTRAAQTYWKATAIAKPELLIGGPVTVGQRVQTTS